jgi:hypothetical protein
MVIRFAEYAVRDIEAIRDWYTEQGVLDLGGRLVAEIVRRDATERQMTN